jgi:hypothetical protein
MVEQGEVRLRIIRDDDVPATNPLNRPMVRKAQAANRPLIADMTGWRPGDPRKQVEWRLLWKS